MEWSTPAAPAIPREQLLLSLVQYCFNDRMIHALPRERDFVGLEFQVHQICFIQIFSQREASQALLMNQLSRAFGCPSCCVKAVLANGLESPKVRGRHFAMDEGSEAGIFE
jgi:hypothetical protein